jgi:diacylglycerol kinase family enzyme
VSGSSSRRGDRIAIIRNPHSGSAIETAALEEALRGVDLTAEILDTPQGPVDEWLDRVAAAHDVVVAAGGDGTVSAVGASVARAGKTLAVIPAGTLNHFARDAGIPIDLDAAVALLRSGLPRAVDIGLVNDQVFLNNVSLGSYPKMVDERSALEGRGRSRPIAAIMATARTWWRLPSLTASLTVDGRHLTRRSPFLVVGNGSYVLSGFALARRHNLSDHQLSLYVAPRAGRLAALSLPMRALAGTLEDYEQFESFSASEIAIALNGRRVLAAIDGEVHELVSPLRFTVKPAALRVLLPSP